MAKSSIIHLKSHSSPPLQNGNHTNTNTAAAAASAPADRSKSADDEIELIAFDMNYTSLKDLIPASPPAAPSPTASRMDSWREIPIKDPLVQHAAWAYLQPMGTARGDEERWWWEMLKDKCCGVFGCLNEVVLVVLFGGLVAEEEEKHEITDSYLDEECCNKS